MSIPMIPDERLDKGQLPLINVIDGQIKYSPGTKPVSLMTLLRWIKNGTLKKPIHQRQKVWTQDKIDRFIRQRIINNKILTIPGCIVTYQLDGTLGLTPRFLNDGSQRMSSVEMFYDNHQHYGIVDKITAEAILESIEIPLQHFIYETAEEAYQEFVDLNNGTLCTAYEAGLGILSYMPNYDQIWEPVLSEIHRICSLETSRMTGKKKLGRETQHKYMRHDYLLFLSFLVPRNELIKYKTSATRLKPAMVKYKSKKIIEYALRGHFAIKDAKYAKQEKDKFINFVIKQSRHFEVIWEEAKAELKKADTTFDMKKKLTMGLYRWSLLTSIWAKKHNVTTENLRHFLTKLFIMCHGGTTLVDSNNPRIKVALAADGLERISTVCDIIGIHLSFAKRKSQNRSQVDDGDHISHKQPFSTHGEGEVFIEDAISNLSRGAAPVND